MSQTSFNCVDSKIIPDSRRIRIQTDMRGRCKEALDIIQHAQYTSDCKIFEYIPTWYIQNRSSYSRYEVGYALKRLNEKAELIEPLVIH